MRRLLVVIALLFVVVCAFGETTHVETFGAWECFETRSMMDDPYWCIMTTGESDCHIIYARDITPPERFIVVFDDYLGLEHERHTEPLRYVSDKTEAQTVRSVRYRTGSSAISFNGEEILDVFLAASEMMFRTKDYRGSNVDAIFILDPAATADAVEWLRAQGE